MDQRLSLVTLGVRDLERARRFYEALGWTSGAAPADDVVFFQAGCMIVALWGREQLAEDSVVEDTGGWGGITLAYNARSPAEVDSVLAEAESAGATIPRGGAETFWGGYSGVFVDPDGHPWEVAHNPHWTLEDDVRDSPLTGTVPLSYVPLRLLIHGSAECKRSRPASSISSWTASEIRAQPAPLGPKPSPGASARRCSVNSRSLVRPSGSLNQT